MLLDPARHQRAANKPRPSRPDSAAPQRRLRAGADEASAAASLEEAEGARSLGRLALELLPQKLCHFEVSCVRGNLR